MGQTRLVTKLRDVGYSEEDLDAMDRPAMLNAWAECVAAGQDKPKIAVQTVGYDVVLEREKLAFEMRRFEAQEKARADELVDNEKARVDKDRMRADELAAKEKARADELVLLEKTRNNELARIEQEFNNAQKLKRMELDSQEKQKDAELKLRDAELKLKTAELRILSENKTKELEIQEKLKDAELKLLSAKQAEKREERDSVVNRAKRYGDAIRTSLFHMGQETLEIISFFRHVEGVFNRYEVPDDLKADLIQPYLNQKSRSIVGRMDPQLSKNYAQIRDIILKENKLTPAAYLEHFNSIVCGENETCVMFAARLKAMFDQYLESRHVNNDYDSLVSLAISDRIKSSLPQGTLRYILGVEASKDEGWLRADALANAVDLYSANHFPNDKPRASAIGAYSTRGSQFQAQSHSGYHTPPSQRSATRQQPAAAAARQSHYRMQQPASSGPVSTKEQPRCYQCNSPSHLRPDCPLRRTSTTAAAAAGPRGSGRVNTCSAGARVSAPIVAAAAAAVCPPSAVVDLCAIVPSVITSISALACQLELGLPEFDNYNNYRDFASLQFKDIYIDELKVRVKALEDSGSELCVIKSAIVDPIISLPQIGTIHLRGIVGKSVEAKLVKLHISPLCCELCESASIPITCAVCPDLNENMILTIPVVKQLTCQHNNLNVPSEIIIAHNNQTTLEVDCADDATVVEDDASNDQTEVDSEYKRRVADSDVLRKEQLNDKSLQPCWEMAKRGKGGFIIKDQLLYHVEKVECIGEKCIQLCLPECRRQCVLELAHNTNHESYRRTRDRIRLSFFWPLLLMSVKQYCRRCEICQKMSRVTVWDRVPIHAVPRSQYAFQVFYADCAGPLFPNQKTNAYNYFFAMCDSATSFPFAYPLRSLSAKNICESMLKTFSITGIPEVVILDNASYNRSALLGETMKRLGCSVRFSTPYHPQGHAPAERLIGSLKSMISKVAAEHPKQWHLHLDYVLWAMRESKNESLGVAPWTLVFSRLPRGPLSVLKESWEGARDLPFSVGKNAQDYLKEIKTRFETVRTFAESHGANAQLKYTNRYNLRSREKQFVVGDQVLILTPDSTASRMFSRWQGPATVIEVCASYSYVVELNGTRHHVHANRLKQFFVSTNAVTLCPDLETISAETITDDLNSVATVNGCAVITDLDHDFGDISTFNTHHTENILPSRRIEQTQIAHLSASEQRELLQLLDEFAVCFSDDPGLCTLAVHEINLNPDYRPRRLRAYRVPEKLKPQVTAEIQRMLVLGIIRPSTSEMVSPLVVVLKGKEGKDGIRLAVDYSYINQFTRNDPFPMPEIETVIQRVGGSEILSSFDASAGYHQTMVRRGDEPLTAFVCDDGVFEFTRTPFGGKACGSTFLRAVQSALTPVKDITESFVDDMIVHTRKQTSPPSSAFSRHLVDIRRFLQRIRDVNLTLKLRKCRFALPEVKFCGKIIGSGTKRPDPDKVATVQALKPGKTKTEVRQLLGFFSYFRDHIPHFAEIAKPLTDLTTKRVSNTVPWNDLHTAALIKLKDALCAATINPLYIANFSLPFHITVDACDLGVAGYLSQINGEGIDCPLAFFSCKLDDSQRPWATVHKEAFAVIVALRKFRNWIFGSEIHVFSDHNPLLFLTESAPKNAKLMRWSLAMSEFNIKFHFIKGKLNVAADCLSRLALEPGDQ